MSTALYNQIADQLLAKRHGLQSPLRLPVEQELAAEHRVARETVRRALRILEEKGAVTRRRGRGTYLQPPHASLTSIRGSTIGFIPPWWAESSSAWFTATVLDGVTRWADEQGCHLSVLHADADPTDIRGWAQRVRSRNLAGLVWVHPQHLQLPLIEHTAKWVPTVILGRHIPDRGLHHVIPDYHQAARLIDEHLVAHGHGQYAMVSVNHLDAFSMNWIQAMEAAHKARGARFNTRGHLLDIKGFDRNKLAAMLLDFYEPVHAEIRAYVLPTSSYLQPLLADERFRRRMAQDISVVTMDYGLYPMDSYWPGHRITHIGCDWARIGRRSLEMLALLAANQDVPEVVREPVKLHEGDTVHGRTADALTASNDSQTTG